MDRIKELLQVSIEDAELADKAFEELMGDDVQKRREFIEDRLQQLQI